MKISISNISGEIKSEIGSLVRFYSVKLRQPYHKFLNKGVFGTNLANLLSETHPIDKNNLSEKLGIQKKDGSLDIPESYENWILKQNSVDKPKFSGIFSV
jgi:hypothetical protein